MQGALELYYEMQQMLAEITGMDGFSLQPCRGSRGTVGVMIIKAYHKHCGDEGAPR